MLPEEKESKNKQVLIIVIVAIVLVLGFVGFKPVENWLQVQREKRFSQDILELQNLVINQKDYTAALAKAETMVKKYPKRVEAWHWKGIAEFQLGKFDEAKSSFQKALAIDPKFQPAKNYLDLLSSGAVIINQNTKKLTQAEFENLLGVSFDKNALTFREAIILPPGPKIKEFINAAYASPKGVKETVKYLKSVILQGPGEKLTVQESETNTIFTKEISEKKIAYTLNIIPAAKGSSVLISYSLSE